MTLNAVRRTWRPSTCTERGAAAAAGAAKQGTADVELVLAMPLLIVLLFMVVGALRVQSARQEAQYDAQAQAFAKAQLFGRATADLGVDPRWPRATLTLRNAPAAIPSIHSLPNRAFVGRGRQSAVLWLGSDASSQRQSVFEDQAAVAGPSWTWTGFPNPLRDAPPVRTWHNRIVSDSIATLKRPLALPND